MQYLTLRHAHTRQNEFMNILQGYPTLQVDEGRTQLSPGMCVGFTTGKDHSNNLVNETSEDIFYLEVGGRTSGDEVVYPDNEICSAKYVGSSLVFCKSYDQIINWLYA